MECPRLASILGSPALYLSPFSLLPWGWSLYSTSEFASDTWSLVTSAALPRLHFFHGDRAHRTRGCYAHYVMAATPTVSRLPCLRFFEAAMPSLFRGCRACIFGCHAFY